MAVHEAGIKERQGRGLPCMEAFLRPVSQLVQIWRLWLVLQQAPRQTRWLCIRYGDLLARVLQTFGDKQNVLARNGVVSFLWEPLETVIPKLLEMQMVDWHDEVSSM